MSFMAPAVIIVSMCSVQPVGFNPPTTDTGGAWPGGFGREEAGDDERSM